MARPALARGGANDAVSRADRYSLPTERGDQHATRPAGRRWRGRDGRGCAGAGTRSARSRGRDPGLRLRHRGNQEPRRRRGPQHRRELLDRRGVARQGTTAARVDRRARASSDAGRRGDRALGRGSPVRSGGAARALVRAVRQPHLVAAARGGDASPAGAEPAFRRGQRGSADLRWAGPARTWRSTSTCRVPSRPRS